MSNHQNERYAEDRYSCHLGVRLPGTPLLVTWAVLLPAYFIICDCMGDLASDMRWRLRTLASPNKRTFVSAHT